MARGEWLKPSLVQELKALAKERAVDISTCCEKVNPRSFGSCGFFKLPP
jgi:hypothetical protein